MTVWPSLGLKAHGDLNHSGVRSIRTMLLSLTFSILNEDLVQTQRKRVDKLSLKKKNTKKQKFWYGLNTKLTLHSLHSVYYVFFWLLNF